MQLIHHKGVLISFVLGGGYNNSMDSSHRTSYKDTVSIKEIFYKSIFKKYPSDSPLF